MLTHNEWELTKRVIGSIRAGPIYASGEPYQYEVVGLPPGERAIIAKSVDPSWQILLIRNEKNLRGWEGSYPDADAAIADLESRLRESGSLFQLRAQASRFR